MQKCVLIVEDKPKNLKLVRDILTVVGYKTLEAVNGREGVDMAMANLPDLILMDIRMPVMDGIEALHEIKSHKSTSHIPIIALTASAMPDEKQRVKNAGFDDYCSKPIDVDFLLELVDKYVNQPGDHNGNNK